MKKAYLYWYKSSETSYTQYIYIIAYSNKQAFYYFNKNNYTTMYDYGCAYEVIEEFKFNKRHNVGDILGANAII